MSRLPTPGGDPGAWATILNDYLGVSLAADGKLGASLYIGGDVHLYRSAAGVLTTDGQFIAAGGSATSPAIYARGTPDTAFGYVSRAASDAVGRHAVLLNGRHEWGDGIVGRDTVLYRYAAAMLKTDGSLTVATRLHVGGELRLANVVGGAVGGAVGYKIPVYNEAGALYGYLPLYAT